MNYEAIETMASPVLGGGGHGAIAKAFYGIIILPSYSRIQSH